MASLHVVHKDTEKWLLEWETDFLYFNKPFSEWTNCTLKVNRSNKVKYLTMGHSPETENILYQHILNPNCQFDYYFFEEGGGVYFRLHNNTHDKFHQSNSSERTVTIFWMEKV